MIKTVEVKYKKPFKFVARKTDYYTVTSSGLLKVTKERNCKKVDVSFVRGYDKLVSHALKNDVFIIEQLDGEPSLSVYVG